MHNIEKCPYRNTARFLKYVWPFFNIMHETVNKSGFRVVQVAQTYGITFSNEAGCLNSLGKEAFEYHNRTWGRKGRGGKGSMGKGRRGQEIMSMCRLHPNFL